MGLLVPWDPFVNAATYRLFMARFAYETDVFIEYREHCGSKSTERYRRLISQTNPALSL